MQLYHILDEFIHSTNYDLVPTTGQVLGIKRPAEKPPVELRAWQTPTGNTTAEFHHCRAQWHRESQVQGHGGIGTCTDLGRQQRPPSLRTSRWMREQKLSSGKRRNSRQRGGKKDRGRLREGSPEWLRWRDGGNKPGPNGRSPVLLKGL